MKLPVLLKRIRECRECKTHLPSVPRPVVQAAAEAKLLIVGQAPGRRVHQSLLEQLTSLELTLLIGNYAQTVRTGD